MYDTTRVAGTRRRLALIGVIAGMVVTLGGCEFLFDFNLLAPLDPVRVASAADLDEILAEDGDAAVLDYLDQELDSPAFIEKLNDPDSAESLTWIEDYLADTWNDGTANESNEQKGAILYSEVKLATSGGDQVINNIAGVALDGDFSPAAGETEAEFYESFFNEVVPPEIQADEDAFKEMIVAMVDANDAYQALGAGATGEFPTGTNAGAVGQNALVCYMIANSTTSAGNATAVADDLWNFVSGGPSPTFNTVDPFDGSDPELANLLEISGLDALDPNA